MISSYWELLPSEIIEYILYIREKAETIRAARWHYFLRPCWPPQARRAAGPSWPPYLNSMLISDYYPKIKFSIGFKNNKIKTTLFITRIYE
tara:strand:- start:306 stop:578 length:273 start_codon:yes stop_codon:yes gene_type:complete